MKKLLILLSFVAFWCVLTVSAFAQTGGGGYQIKGVVFDEVGPVIGATVIEQGTKNGASTQLDGDFTLRVASSKSTVEISCIGYKTVTFVASELPAKIVLEQESLALDETVVVGYGSLSKREISSSIVSVSSEDFNKGASDVMALIVGKVAGLNVDMSSSGTSSSYQIRGATSIKGSNSPLVVIDGIPGGSLSSISTQDVESISVLKDGASSAIYGTRGANGVILVTTRKGSGEAGKVRITYDSYFAVNMYHKFPEFLTIDEYLQYRVPMGFDDYGNREDNLLYNLLKGKLNYTNNQYLSLSGSTTKSNYNVSLTYNESRGYDKFSHPKNYSIRTSTNTKALNDLLEITTLTTVRANQSGKSASVTGNLTGNPTIPYLNEDGSYVHSDVFGNPYETAMENSSDSKGTNITAQGDVKLYLLRTENSLLTTNANLSLTYSESKSMSYTPSTVYSMIKNEVKGSASISHSKSWSRNVEWLVNYNFNKNKHSVKFVGGYSYHDSNSESFNVSNSDFDQDSFLYNSIGSGSYLKSGQAGMGSSKSDSRTIGFFGRGTYSWGNLVTATASLRYEGATKFGVNHKWGLFPAVSAAWTISNMGFMASTKGWLNELRFRASYGETGRSAGDSYTSLATYSGGNYYYIDGEWVHGFKIARNSNPNFGWETAVSYDAGFDFELFNHKLSGSIEYFDRRSKDLVYSYTAPQPPYVYNSITINLGETMNIGAELALSYNTRINKDFSLNISGTYSYGRGKLVSLGNDIFEASYVDMVGTGMSTANSDYFFRLDNGRELGSMYLYEHAGFDDKTGELMVYNADGEAVLASTAKLSDKKYLGNTMPKHLFSINPKIVFRNWDLAMNLRGAAGFDIWNAQMVSYGYPGVQSANVLKSAYEKWSFMTVDAKKASSFFLEKGDWFKIEKISLGRTFKFKKNNKYGIDNMYMYLSATNIATFTGFTGVDPSTVGTNGLTPGISGSNTLVQSRITYGLQIRF